jgi:NAD(P)-dependent dehydrogenase (short-subunit alcohol dehydrogenase family)
LKPQLILYAKSGRWSYSARKSEELRLRSSAAASGQRDLPRIGEDRAGAATLRQPGRPEFGSPQARAIKAQFKRYPFSVGEPEDIARIALFLASDEARMITGAIIPADGGLSAY